MNTYSILNKQVPLLSVRPNICVYSITLCSIYTRRFWHYLLLSVCFCCFLTDLSTTLVHCNKEKSMNMQKKPWELFKSVVYSMVRILSIVHVVHINVRKTWICIVFYFFGWYFSPWPKVTLVSASYSVKMGILQSQILCKISDGNNSYTHVIQIIYKIWRWVTRTPYLDILIICIWLVLLESHL